jgi:hypothetical protein
VQQIDEQRLGLNLGALVAMTIRGVQQLHRRTFFLSLAMAVVAGVACAIAVGTLLWPSASSLGACEEGVVNVHAVYGQYGISMVHQPAYWTLLNATYAAYLATTNRRPVPPFSQANWPV